MLSLVLVCFSCKKEEPKPNVPDPVEEEPVSFELSNFYIASEAGSGTDIYSFDGEAATLEATINQKCEALFADSDKQNLILASGDDDIVAYNLNFEEQWRLVSLNTSFPYFHNFREGIRDYFTFIATDEQGQIIEYDGSGKRLNTTIVEEHNMFPYEVDVISSDYTFVKVQDYSKSKEELHVYYAPTGQFRYLNVFTDTELIATGDLGETSLQVPVFVNENGVGKVKVSNLDTYATNDFKDLGVKIHDVLRLNKNEYIIATETGIGIYDYSKNTFGTFNSSVLASKLYLNKADGRVIATQANNLYFFDDDGAIANEYNHTANILGFGVMYK